MKKTLMFVVILALLCAGSILFIGCQKEEAAKEEIVISIPHYKAGQNVGGKFFLPQVERFNEKYAGTYKLVIEEIPQDSYSNKIKQLAQQDNVTHYSIAAAGHAPFISHAEEFKNILG